MKPEHFDAVAAAGSKTTVGGAVMSIFGMVSVSEAMAIVGALVAMFGFIVNAYYKRKSDSRAEQLHWARMKRLEQGKTDHGALGDEETDARVSSL